MSFFVLVGVYALSVIDAYVDAELSVFDISKDLSLKVEPTILNNHSSSNMLDASSVVSSELTCLPLSSAPKSSLFPGPHLQFPLLSTAQISCLEPV